MGKQRPKQNGNGKSPRSTSRNNVNARDVKFRPKKQGMQSEVDGESFSNSERGAAARVSRSNPISFYNKFDKFMTDAANIPFAAPLGRLFDMGPAKDVPKKWAAPGVMRLVFAPTIGVSSDFSSAINRSSIRFYTYLRSNQKASATYDHQDITMMMVALDSAYMYHALMTKVYSVINLFTPANEYYSRTVVAACGFDFDDIRAHLQNFRSYINAFAYSLGQYALPKDLALFDRHRWMCEGLYVDSESTRAQTYLFVPQYFYKYDNTVTTGSQCVATEWISPDSSTNTIYTYEQARQFGEAILNAISNEEDFAVISGDLYNFYGGDTYKLPFIDEQYSVLPVYDRTVLSQIENAEIVGVLGNTTVSQNPTVNNGAIIFQPTLSVSGNQWIDDRIYMNFHWDSPTPEQVVEASRLIPVIDGSTSDEYKIVECGTEIVEWVEMYTRNPETGKFRAIRLMSSEVLLALDGSDIGTNLSTAITDTLMLAQFKQAPKLGVWLQPGASEPWDKIVYSGLTWDVDNMEFVPDQYMMNIHLACLLSLFTVAPNRE
nr:putative capsid [Marmot picobirnavirus]